MSADPQTPCFVVLCGPDVACAVRIIGGTSSKKETQRFLEEHRGAKIIVRPLHEANRLHRNYSKVCQS